MSDDDGGDGYDDGGAKESVDVGSGDFNTNEIYGDKPQSLATTYNEPDNQAMGNDDEQYDNENNDNENNDNENNEYQQEEYNNNENNEYNNNENNEEPPPPEYQQDAPPPPQSYDANTVNEQDNTGYDYNQEPEDVVSAMNTGNNDNDDEIDYGIAQPKTEVDNESDPKPGSGFMGNFFIRTLWMGISFFIVSIMGFAIWFNNTPTDSFGAGYGMSGFGSICFFFASAMAIVLSIAIKRGIDIPKINIFVLATMILYVTGGAFYFIGGCAVAYGYNDLGISSLAGIFFTEGTFIGVHGIVAGIDLWKQILNNKKWRELIYNGAFIFLAVVDFFAYAVLSGQAFTSAGAGFLAAMYFFAMIPPILYLILWIPALKERLAKPFILLILAASLMVIVVMILIAYFVFIGDTGNGGAYFVGVGVFVMMTGTAICLDMFLDRFIPGFRPNDESVAGGAAVPTTNPDSPNNDGGDYDNQ